MGPLGLAQIFIFVGFLELFVMKQKEGSFPGDMSRVNPFEKQWESFDEETKLRKRAIELNNGRAAMMGIFAMIVHEIISNQPYIINDIIGKHVGLRFDFPWCTGPSKAFLCACTISQNIISPHLLVNNLRWNLTLLASYRLVGRTITIRLSSARNKIQNGHGKTLGCISTGTPMNNASYKCSTLFYFTSCWFFRPNSEKRKN